MSLLRADLASPVASNWLSASVWQAVQQVTSIYHHSEVMLMMTLPERGNHAVLKHYCQSHEFLINANKKTETNVLRCSIKRHPATFTVCPKSLMQCITGSAASHCGAYERGVRPSPASTIGWEKHLSLPPVGGAPEPAAAMHGHHDKKHSPGYQTFKMSCRGYTLWHLFLTLDEHRVVTLVA